LFVKINSRHFFFSCCLSWRIRLCVDVLVRCPFPFTGILVPVSGPPRSSPGPPLLHSMSGGTHGGPGGSGSMLRKVFLCPTCKVRFPVPEPDPETSFKANFSCHVLFKHLRAEVENEMGGCEDLEVCPADDCEYNIVQLKVGDCA
jgi:hypothetical protein